MLCFEGTDAAVYALGEPVSFRRLPLADCGDGFEWWAADESVCSWLGDLVFEVHDGDEWSAVAASEVGLAAATVSFGRCLVGKPVCVSGLGVTTTLALRSVRWSLEQEVKASLALGGQSFARGAATARLDGVEEGLYGAVPVRRVLAVLRSAAVGAFVGVGALVRDAATVSVLFDEQGVSYASR